MRTHEGAIRSLAWSSDGALLASSSWDKTVRLWTETLHEQRVLPAAEMISSLAFLPGTRTLATVGNAGTLELVTATGGRKGRDKGRFPLYAVAVAPSGQLIAAGGAVGEITLWRLPDLGRVAALAGHEWNVYSLAFTPGARALVSGAADGTVRVWDVPACRLAETFRWHKSWVTCVAVAPDGMTAAAGSADGTVVVWDLEG